MAVPGKLGDSSIDEIDQPKYNVLLKSYFQTDLYIKLGDFSDFDQTLCFTTLKLLDILRDRYIPSTSIVISTKCLSGPHIYEC